MVKVVLLNFFRDSRMSLGGSGIQKIIIKINCNLKIFISVPCYIFCHYRYSLLKENSEKMSWDVIVKISSYKIRNQ